MHNLHEIQPEGRSSTRGAGEFQAPPSSLPICPAPTPEHGSNRSEEVEHSLSNQTSFALLDITLTRSHW